MKAKIGGFNPKVAEKFTTTKSIKAKTAKKTAKKVVSTAKIQLATTPLVTETANPNDWKNAKHNRKFPRVKVSRTEMVQLINSTKGKFFTSTHIDAQGHARTMNCIKSNKPADELGLLTVYSMMDKGYRMINPQTLTDLSFNQTHYYTGKKSK